MYSKQNYFIVQHLLDSKAFRFVVAFNKIEIYKPTKTSKCTFKYVTLERHHLFVSTKIQSHILARCRSF